MKVLVTGGAGYIGSVVSEVLLGGGHEVVVYDSLEQGHRDAVAAGAAFVHADLHNRQALRQTFDRYRIDAVVHMAAHCLVGESVADPARYYANNVVAGLALLDTMRDCGVGSIVFSSTAAVYGETAKQPIEEDAPLRPANPYGETKLAFERALAWYHGAYGMRYVSLRYFNAAGATGRMGERHDPETHLIPLVLQTAAGLRPAVTVFGNDYPTRDGTCVRDYVHVLDLARAHVLALQALGSGSRKAEIYNLGCGGDGYTVLDVIETARRVAGRPVAVEFGPRRPGDPAVLIAASSRIAESLGWRPELQDLGAILESAWRWMQLPR